MSNYGFGVDASTDRDDQTVTNDDWFVSLSLAEFCETYSIPKKFSNELIIEKLVACMDSINGALAEFVEVKKSQGYASIDLVPSPKLNNVSAKVIQYKRAVYAATKAELVRTNISLSLSADSEAHAKGSDDLYGHYVRLSTKAIARIQDKRSTGVYLI